MNVPDDLRALADGGGPVPPGLGGPASTVLGARRAFRWFRDEDVAVWGPPDGSEVWMVSIEHPSFAGSPAEVLAALGEPAMRLDTALGTVAIAGGEWVYPDRGLTVFADEEDERVFRVNVFAPVAPSAYAELYVTQPGERRRPSL